MEYSLIAEFINELPLEQLVEIENASPVSHSTLAPIHPRCLDVDWQDSRFWRPTNADCSISRKTQTGYGSTSSSRTFRYFTSGAISVKERCGHQVGGGCTK